MSVVIVVLPMGQVLMPVPWIIVVVVAWKRESRHDRGTVTLATYIAVTVLMAVAAVFAPVKTSERVLDRAMVLPTTELTIAEMNREKYFENTQWLPRFIYVTTTTENADKQIRFRTTDITLREFVDTIESQSELRHRFMHCGNGSSILFGGDCCFGVRLR